jgi:hypothetical protein
MLSIIPFINFGGKLMVGRRSAEGGLPDHGEVVNYCYDLTLITEPKSPPIQSISILFDLKVSCRFLRLPDLLQSLAAEIILPTKAHARYGDQIDKYLVTLK